MGAMTAVMVGMGVVSAGAQIMGGFAAGNEADANARAVTSEANYNAAIYEQQAGMIEQQKNNKIAQDKRQIRFVQAQTVAMTAHKGIEMSGSPLAILIDTTTQMNMDMAINAYNYDMEKYGALSAAESTRRQGYTKAEAYRRSGDTARMGGVIGGLTTLFQTGVAASSPSFSPAQKTPTKAINTGNSLYYRGGTGGFRDLI